MQERHICCLSAEDLWPRNRSIKLLRPLIKPSMRCQASSTSGIPVAKRVSGLEEWASTFEASVRERWAAESCRTSTKSEENLSSESFLFSDPEENLWNLNALAVICLKGNGYTERNASCLSSLKTADEPDRIGPESQLSRFLDPFCLQIVLCVLPLLLSISMVVILAGLQDQFAAVKQYIYGDGYYYSYTWRFSRTARNRDRFTPVAAPNGTLLGYTADILGPDRPAAEADRCLDAADSPLPALGALLHAPNRSALDPWPLLDAARASPLLDWSFTHCIAWEYAGLCAAVLEANLPFERADPADRPGLRSWHPPMCYLSRAGRAVSLDDWRALSAPPDELRAARAAQLAPRRVEPRLDLAVWITTVNVAAGKSPAAPAADGCSMFLYSRLAFLYVLGDGDAYACELVAVVLLSLYLFATAFLGEIVQLVHQVALALSLRRYEAAWLERLEGPAAAPPPPPLPPATQPSVAAYALWLAGDVACDVLLSFRLLFLALMTSSAPMILTMDHGVVASIFSALALSYLFDFDDSLLRSLDAVGFRRSRLAASLVRPCVCAFLAAGRSEPDSAPQDRGALRDGGAAGWTRMRRAVARVASMASMGAWAVLLCVGLCAYHLSVAYLAVTDDRVAARLFKEFDDYTLRKLVAACFCAAAAAALARDGPAALPGAVQLLGCLGWVYIVTRWAVWTVLLAWSDATQGGTPAGLGWYMDMNDGALRADRAFVVPALALHAALALLRPVPVLWLAARRRRRLAAQAGGVPGSEPPVDLEKNA